MATTVKRPKKPQPAKWLLVQAGIPQREVVARSGLGPSQVSSSLAGQITPSRRVAEACAQILDRPVEELFDRDLLEASHWYIAADGGDGDE